MTDIHSKMMEMYLELTPQDKIAKAVGVSQATVAKTLPKLFGWSEYFKLVKKIKSAGAVAGGLKRRVDKDTIRYRRIKKPSWFTGSGSSDTHVEEHKVVLLRHLGLTELPKGACVHHVDGDKRNNSISNLVLMDTTDHIKYHKR